MHQNFKINGNSFTKESLQDDINILINSKEIYQNDIGLFLNDWFNDMPFVEVKTSGSTGKPKIIQLQKEHMVNSAQATGKYFNVTKKTKALLCLPVSYIAGKMMLVRAIVLGWDLYIVSPNANPLSDTKNTFDFCAMIPLQVEKSLAQLHQVKKLIIGGAPISSSLLSKIQSLKTNCFATYGMTETITHIAVKKLNNFPELNITSTCFQLLPNVNITQDNRGCLVIQAPKVANDQIITNDVINQISANEFEWLGRFDHVINSGGIKLFPEKIEEQLSKLISSRFFVAGLPDEKLGLKLVVIIENEKLDESLMLKEIKALGSLSKYEYPKSIYFLSKFKETPTGKIKRSDTLKLISF